MSALGELGIFEQIFVIVLFFCCISPYISAYRGNTSIALATILSLMLASFVQFAISVIQGVPVEMGWVVSVFGIRPSIATSPVESYRFITSAWIHAGWIHVLGNILVIGLVGIPLEQRMGGKRWMTVYILGLLGGNIAWVFTHRPHGLIRRLFDRLDLHLGPHARGGTKRGADWYTGVLPSLIQPLRAFRRAGLVGELEQCTRE